MTTPILEEVARAMLEAYGVPEDCASMGRDGKVRRAIENRHIEARAAAGVLLRHLREMAMEGPMLGTNDIDGLAHDLGIEMEG